MGKIAERKGNRATKLRVRVSRVHIDLPKAVAIGIIRVVAVLGGDLGFHQTTITIERRIAVRQSSSHQVGHGGGSG